MGADCYMYINVLSKSIVSIRPDDYEDDPEELMALERRRAEEIARQMEDSNGLPSWALPNVRYESTIYLIFVIVNKSYILSAIVKLGIFLR